MSVTRAAIESARAMLHEDLDTLIDVLLGAQIPDQECDPIIVMNPETGGAYMWCIDHDAVIRVR